jgi:hypothetical protein
MSLVVLVPHKALTHQQTSTTASTATLVVSVLARASLVARVLLEDLASLVVRVLLEDLASLVARVLLEDPASLVVRV